MMLKDLKGEKSSSSTSQCFRKEKKKLKVLKHYFWEGGLSIILGFLLFSGGLGP
jgi:hypothetical protein